MYKKEIKTAIEKYSECPLFESKVYHSMAKRYPEGELAFWIKKRYEYVEKIRQKSWLGGLWVNSDCPDMVPIEGFLDEIDDLITEYLNKYFQSSIKLLSRNPDFQIEKYKYDIAKDEIDNFLQLLFEYMAVEAIIDELKNLQITNSFSSYFKNSNPKLIIEELRKHFPSGKDKEAAIMTFALHECDIIDLPTKRRDLIYSIAKEWNVTIKDTEGFDKYFRKYLKIKERKGTKSEQNYPGEVTAAIKFSRSLVAI